MTMFEQHVCDDETGIVGRLAELPTRPLKPFEKGYDSSYVARVPITAGVVHWVEHASGKRCQLD